MTLIYKIVDNTNGNIYVGSTNQLLRRRIASHKKHRECTSREIIKNNNYDFIIIEECNEENRNEREQYYIDTLSCVNKKKAFGQVNRQSEEYKKNKKEYDKNRKAWRMTWGETTRDVCNLFYTKSDLFS